MHFQFILNMKILSTLIFSLLTTVLYAQTVNYQVEIVEFQNYWMRMTEFWI